MNNDEHVHPDMTFFTRDPVREARAAWKASTLSVLVFSLMFLVLHFTVPAYGSVSPCPFGAFITAFWRGGAIRVYRLVKADDLDAMKVTPTAKVVGDVPEISLHSLCSPAASTRMATGRILSR